MKYEKTHTCPYLGSTEREVLENVDTIVTTSLPIEKVQQYYSQVDSAGREVVLMYVAFYESQKLVRIYNHL